MKAYATKFDLAVNWVKVKPVIVWINYDGPQAPILHTKSQRHRSIGSKGEGFKMILPYTDMADIFVKWPNSNLLIFISLFLKAFLWNLVTNGPVVSEKNKF